MYDAKLMCGYEKAIAYIDSSIWGDLCESSPISYLYYEAAKKLTEPKYLSTCDSSVLHAFDSTWDDENHSKLLFESAAWKCLDTSIILTAQDTFLDNVDYRSQLLKLQLDVYTDTLKGYFAQYQSEANDYSGWLAQSLREWWSSISSDLDTDTIMANNACSGVDLFSLCSDLPHGLSINEFKGILLKSYSEIRPLSEEIFNHKCSRLIEYAEEIERCIRKTFARAFRAICQITVRPVTQSNSVELKEGEQLWPLLMAFKNH